MDMLLLDFYFMVALLTMWGKEVLKWHFSVVQVLLGLHSAAMFDIWHQIGQELIFCLLDFPSRIFSTFLFCSTCICMQYDGIFCL